MASGMSRYVVFDKIVPEGKALGYLDGRALFAVGPLPGEGAVVDIRRAKRTWAEAAVVDIPDSDRRRGPAREAHSLSCSPWQGVDYAYQLKLKEHILREVFSRPELNLDVAGLLPAPRQFGYRNKLEWTLVPDEADRLGLAFHARGSFRNFLPAPEGCVLGTDAMNAAARELVGQLNVFAREARQACDTLTVRQSQSTGELIAVLLLKSDVEADWGKLERGGLKGLGVVKKHGHGEYEVLWQTGLLELEEELAGVRMVYPWDSFFQVNVPVFAQALERILGEVPTGGKVVDLYGGVGTIGLPAARIACEVLGIEVVASSVALAERNGRLNGLENYRAQAVPSEKMDPGLLQGSDLIILDPPRAGLHAKVIEFLQVARPPKIVYLSCNPVTQARDLMLLKAGGYGLSPVTGFDFYPGTLHLESLVVLTRRA